MKNEKDYGLKEDGEYTLIIAFHLYDEIDGYTIGNPKNLHGMNKDKALGAIKWWRRIVADKRYPCFVYDPSEETIFNADINDLFSKDNSYNVNKINELILKFDGDLPKTYNKFIEESN